MRWHAPCDPECPGVQRIYSALDDPMTQHYGVGDDILEDQLPKHQRKCARCQEYGAANIEVV
jgi:hypothetical protein